MPFKFNPFSGNFDQTGSGGGGSSYIDGEVATYADLPLDGTAAINSAWLVREASGTWLLSRKPAGIYIRTATAGVSRDADYTYAGILPDVFSDANFTLYDDADSTKNAKFQLSGITTGTTRTLTVPNNSGTITLNSDLAAIATSGSASDLTTGTVATARLGTGTASGTTYLAGDQTWKAVSGGSKTYAVFTAEHNQPPSTAFATLDTRNSIAVLDFDAATDESAVFVGVIPEGAVLTSGLTVYLHWMATSATSGNVRWGAQIERSNTDLDSDSFDTATEANGAANGTSGIVTVTSITLTNIDSVTAGDLFRLKVFRNADDATNDTMTGDAELVAVEVRSAA